MHRGLLVPFYKYTFKYLAEVLYIDSLNMAEPKYKIARGITLHSLFTSYGWTEGIGIFVFYRRYYREPSLLQRVVVITELKATQNLGICLVIKAYPSSAP